MAVESTLWRFSLWVVKFSGCPKLYVDFWRGWGQVRVSAPNLHVVQGSPNTRVTYCSWLPCLVAIFNLEHIRSLSLSFMALTVLKKTVIPLFLQKKISYFLFFWRFLVTRCVLGQSTMKVMLCLSQSIPSEGTQYSSVFIGMFILITWSKYWEISSLNKYYVFSSLKLISSLWGDTWRQCKRLLSPQIFPLDW